MALSGLREMSIIATPPVDRLAVRTYVTPFDQIVIREALLREKYRGGQAYYVVPRISDLPDLERYLREQVPEVRFVVGHGQMAPTQLEEVMTAFYDGQYDVLLSTTIVESQHSGHSPGRYVWPVAAVSIARPGWAGQGAGLCLYDHAGRKADHAVGRAPAEGVAVPR
jgi:superfamily II DNA/RNA helicase